MTTNFFLIVAFKHSSSAPKISGGATPSKHLSNRSKKGLIISGQQEK